MATSNHTRPIRYWPGGIPASVQYHPTKQLTEQEKDNGNWDFPTPEETIEESKGWLLFVEEQWLSREAAGSSDEDEEYELRQRRSLVEKWASADQSFRDSFHNRAHPRKSAIDYPSSALERLEDTRQDYSSWVCINPVDTPLKRARFVKFLILCYRLDGQNWHPEPNGEILPTMVKPNPATFPDANNFTISDFPMWAVVETADFKAISMSVTGHLILETNYGPYFIIDQASLETGRFFVVEYKSTGHIDHIIPRRPYFLTDLVNYSELGFTVERMEEENIGGREQYQNQPIDMDLPILDIIQKAKDNNQMTKFFYTERDQWEKDIELYAPGYLAMEAEGRASEYDIRNLRDTREASRARCRG
ncbi:hypothetical protein DTO212C5_1070 [Paecilomyces variotii]|nr:hypothetical protein DTO212C5_1070 [Paecilomyces variotii]